MRASNADLIISMLKELKKEIGDKSKHAKDLELLVSQSKRCSDILRRISRKEIEDDQFINIVKVEDLLEEIIISFKETKLVDFFKEWLQFACQKGWQKMLKSSLNARLRQFIII